ncbi:MAG: hypothetical protein IGS48_22750 [Oscillatoriales cyanobacterium C42_A2020_001]|nr:hypothetical protein [Leptolyngbyaceae cyanobacterium C42_A2020_001]
MAIHPDLLAYLLPEAIAIVLCALALRTWNFQPHTSTVAIPVKVREDF